MRGRALADFTADRRLLVLAAMAVAVGTGGSFAAWGLLKLIGLTLNLVWFQRVAFNIVSLAHAPRNLWMVAAPVLGGLIIGLMARFGSDKIRGHGIPEAIEAILIGGSRMSPKVAVLKPLSSAISIGSAGPFGAEGPIIMTGGAIGSLFAQCFHLSAAERKTLLVAGAAAGMTSIFNTPVAAVLLAIELLLFEWRPRSFIPVVAGVVTAVCWRSMLFGVGPLFPSVASLSFGGWALVSCVALGGAVGVVAGALSKLLYVIEDLFEHLPIHWMWWPALGGVVVGLGGLVEPRALAVGYDVIGDLLAGHLLLQAIVAVLVVKTVIWLLALSSGTSGGVLAPLMIIGGALGWLASLVLPGDHGAWVLVGMAAMLGGAMRAPLMGAVFAVEFTGDFHLLPNLLAATAAAYAVTVLLMKRSILTEKIARRGRHIAYEYGVDPFQLARVSDVMAREVETLPATATVADAVRLLEQGRHRCYPVVDALNRPIGLVTRADALHWGVESASGGETLQDLAFDAELPTVRPDDLALQAIEVMLATDQGRLPVVDPNSGVLVGLLARKDLLQVRARAAQAEDQRQAYLIRSPSAA
jgi:H+/Cl- antiporter ClcA/CBS domain-containing protein